MSTVSRWNRYKPRDLHYAKTMDNSRPREWPVRPLWIFNGILLAVIMIAGVFLGRGDIVEKSFGSYTQAAESDRTWLTVITPSTATDIKIKYNLDTNQRILTFSYPGNFDFQRIQHCRQMPMPEVPWPGMKAGWWPRELTPNNLPATPRHSFYDCRREEGIFALNPRQNRAFFWSR